MVKNQQTMGHSLKTIDLVMQKYYNAVVAQWQST